MRQWLPAGHPVWLVIEAVRRLDTRVFHAGRRTGGAGAAGYDPDMLVTLLIWAYANGITSSRRIERLCQQDVAFRVICAGHVPDHVTVARFRQLFAETAADLFAEVLVLCARLGMGQVGTVALDGTKIAASASKDANRTEEGLRKLAAGLAAAHAEADAQEDALFGAGRRGDDDPGDPFTRMERVAAALADLAAERQAREVAERAAAQAHLEAARAGAPVQGRRPAAAEVALAEVKVAREIAAYQGKVAARQEAVAAGRRSAGWAAARPGGEYCRVRRARAGLERARAGRPREGVAREGLQEIVLPAEEAAAKRLADFVSDAAIDRMLADAQDAGVSLLDGPGRADRAADGKGYGAGAGRGNGRSPGVRERRPGGKRVGEFPQRLLRQDAHHDVGAGADRGAPGPEICVRAADRAERAAARRPGR